MSLTSVKYLADIAAQEIIDNRPYLTYNDFVRKVQKRKVNKRVKKGLYALGAFSELQTDDDKTPEDALGLDDFEILSDSETQKEYLGYIVPTKHLFEIIAECKERGMKAGVIHNIEQKTSKYGEYYRFNLLPKDSVLTRNQKLLQVLNAGMAVAFSVNEIGKILQAHKL